MDVISLRLKFNVFDVIAMSNVCCVLLRRTTSACV
jgi:hypothetical protein